MAVVEEGGRFLVVERADRAGLGFPGGFLKFDETVEEGLTREVLEETGYETEPVELLCIRSGPSEFPVYTVDIVWTCRVTGGALRPSWEGEPLWLEDAELDGRLAYDFDEILARYKAWRAKREDMG
jgi:ADP-ribose pyrophosphatase YjhB (NUDIX family)